MDGGKGFIDLGDLPVEVFEADRRGIEVESLTSGHDLTELGASCSVCGCDGGCVGCCSCSGGPPMRPHGG